MTTYEPKPRTPKASSLPFEAELWAAAGKLRGHRDASEYKHVVLGLIFLKYISDAFEEKRSQLLLDFSDPGSAWHIKEEPQREQAAEERDEYTAANVFWVPVEARWHSIEAKARSPEIGRVIDDAMGLIEKENPTLKGVLPRDYGRPTLDKVKLGELVDIITNIGFAEKAERSKDILGRVYEYFLGHIAIYGQESNPTTWKLARMNLAIRGLDANLGPRNADTFLADLHPDLKADPRKPERPWVCLNIRTMGPMRPRRRM